MIYWVGPSEQFPRLAAHTVPQPTIWEWFSGPSWEAIHLHRYISLPVDAVPHCHFPHSAPEHEGDEDNVFLHLLATGCQAQP